MSSVNTAVLSIVIVCIVLLIIVIVLAAVYGTKPQETIVYVKDDKSDNKPDNVKQQMRAALSRANSAKVVATIKDQKQVKKLLASDSPVAIMVFADWCGFCKKLHPIMDELAADNSIKVEMYKINADDASEVLKEYGINGYPVTLTNFAEKKYIGFKPKNAMYDIMKKAPSSRAAYSRVASSESGAAARAGVLQAAQRAAKKNALTPPEEKVRRMQAGMQARMQTQAQPQSSVEELDSEADVASFLNGNSKAIVMVYADWCGFCKKMKQVLDNTLRQAAARGVKVGKVNYEKVPQMVKAQEIRGFPGMVSNFGKKKYSGYMPEEDFVLVLQS